MLAAVRKAMLGKHNVNYNKSNLEPSFKDDICNEFSGSKFNLGNQNVATFVRNCNYCITLSHDNFNIRFIVPDESTVPHFMMIKSAKRIAAMCTIFSIPRFNVYIIPVPIPRKFPSKGIVSPDNINGGYTYIEGTDIYIYRQEEWPKVLLHEFLHRTIADSYSHWDHKKVATFKSLYNIHSGTPLLMNEAVIEALAIVYHMSFLSLELGLDFKRLYTTEMQWTRQQVERMLLLQSKLPNQIWIEQSNAFAYIIIKYLLLKDITRFLKIQPRDTKAVSELLLEQTLDVVASKKNSYVNASMRMTVFGDL